MKTSLKNIEHDYKNVEEYGFFVFNILESENPNPNISDLLKSNLLDKAYFFSKEQIEKWNQQWNEFFKPIPENGEVIEIYGPVLKEKISPLDFVELNYKEYVEKIENYISEWTKKGWTDLASELKKLHYYSKDKLSSENPEKRKFHFMDAENVEKSRQYEINWYEYFFTVISTLENSNRIIVMNFGND
ncbi:hypothetical protein C7447_104177 [Tenacibaculum adriaticum]|uniref:Uncharacterized protein n=1 Tax=Tenacibaculum adriaticum TaxID=413713 RepID=A0A5S5DQ30_9FLAO|nr:hypothetical protein [Tenacibaculum adriaticum]TYP97488.1 hypothetical protein C7447_104177 [Tenacibaculum adriaticum]